MGDSSGKLLVAETVLPNEGNRVHCATFEHKLGAIGLALGLVLLACGWTEVSVAVNAHRRVEESDESVGNGWASNGLLLLIGVLIPYVGGSPTVGSRLYGSVAVRSARLS